MAAVTLLGSATFDTASGTKTVTATPAVNDLIVIVTAHSGNTSAATPTDDQSGTYVEITSAVKATSADTMRVFIRTALISSAVSTVFTHAPGTTTGGGLAVLKVTGMSRTGASAARQSAKEENVGTAGTPAPVFSSAPLTGNPVIGAAFTRDNPTALTPRTSFTELVDTGYDNPASGLHVQSRDSGETATTQTWGSSTASGGWCSIVVELDTSASGTTYNETISETATPGDSLSAAMTFNATIAETATPGETLASIATYNVTLSETATPGDSYAGGMLISETISETATPGDSYSATAIFNNLLTETATPGDSYAFGGFFKDAAPASIALAADAAPGALTLTPAATPPNVSLS